MSKPIRILHVLNGLGTGGAEAIIMNWYRNIDREKVQFDFLIRSNENIYTKEITEYGGKVYVMPPYPSNYFENRKATAQFFKEHAKEYAGIHVHGNALLYVNVFNIAKKNGIDLRIYHSHSDDTEFKYKLLHFFNKLRIKNLATEYFACSKEAGKWAFSDNEFKVIKNGINIEDFLYREHIREEVRKRLNISTETVYGHVGRFEKVKNHIFLLDIFEEILYQDSNSMLLLLGEGSLFEEIKELAKAKGIDSNIKFIGAVKNVGEYLNAMDAFLLPSLHEGLGIVAIEAQTASLPTLLSDTIPHEVRVTDYVSFIPITQKDAWVECALKMLYLPRKDMKKEITKAGYDIKQSVKYLECFYCSNV